MNATSMQATDAATEPLDGFRALALAREHPYETYLGQLDREERRRYQIRRAYYQAIGLHSGGLPGRGNAATRRAEAPDDARTA